MIAIYLSHPFTGNEEENRKKASAYAAEIVRKRSDILVVNPLDAMQYVDNAGELEYMQVLMMTIELMIRCDAVVAMGDWRNSRGCCAVYKIAYERGLYWMESIDEVLQYKGY